MGDTLGRGPMCASNNAVRGGWWLERAMFVVGGGVMGMTLNVMLNAAISLASYE